MSMCSYCGAAKGEYCGTAQKVYRGGECGAARKAREQTQRRFARLRQIPMGRLFLDFARLHANACMMGESENVSMKRYRAADDASRRAHDRICRAIEGTAEDVIAFVPDFPSMTP